MTAKEMFEKLGFNYEETPCSIEYWATGSGYIDFYINQKIYCFSDRAIDVVLHKAIRGIGVVR